MKTKFRNVIGLIITATVLSVGTVAAAGVADKAAQKLRDQKSDQKAEQKSGGKSDARPAQGSQSGRNAQPQRDDRVRGSSGSQAPPPRTSGRDSRDDNGGRNGGSNGNRDSNRNGGGDRGSVQGPVQGPVTGPVRGSSRDLRDDLDRLYGGNRDRDRGHNGNNGGGNGDHGGRDYHPPRVVDRLPIGYRDYYWNGSRYYLYGGHWYRPYGSSFITIGVPIGLFVTTLPGLYTSVWVDNTRYYYADRTYYIYEPVRRGYVVTRSPYGDDEEYYDGEYDDLYVYPARGQSEQQQADDRYQCHRWAVDQSDYDPLDDEYDAERSDDYRRAITACLTGRGYTVN